jgi:hypothetical protein
MAQKNVSAASEAGVEVTMQEFADLLNVSQPFVAPLLESGDFPFRVVGTKRFVPRFDALGSKLADDAIRNAAVPALSVESEELALYENGSELVADPA